MLVGSLIIGPRQILQPEKNSWCAQAGSAAFHPGVVSKALSKQARASTSPNLKMAFETHLHETHGQIERNDQAVEASGICWWKSLKTLGRRQYRVIYIAQILRAGGAMRCTVVL
ncbi:DUF892 family protein [Caballeronia sp.]|uniref:DUF892 family protein n=1 Tax=Caballeronia sp. TaxID=1931223 RepID=UPI003C360D57